MRIKDDGGRRGGMPMSSSGDKEFHCPNCGSRINARRIGTATNAWDVAKLVVIFAGIIGIIAAWKHW
jgi:hypothetical protein